MPVTWELDDIHVEFQATCRAVVDEQVRPLVRDAEAAGAPPRELMTKLGGAGLLGLSIPEEHGGSGGDALAVALLAEELARASGGLAVTALVSGYMAAPHLTRFGTEAQQTRYLPGLASGSLIASIAVTEPDTGSDVASVATVARPVDDGWQLRGTKTYITNAGVADVLILAGRTSDDAGHRGITTFLVDAGAPGLSFGPPLAKMGWHSSDTREVILDGVVVGADDVLGTVDRGFYQIMEAFQLERVTLAGMGLGHGAECLDLVRDHIKNRMAFGEPLANLQTVRHRVAVMEIDLAAARLMTYQAAARLDAGHPDAARSVAMAKYHAALAADRIVDSAVQLFGGSGFVEETTIARHYRDTRILRIGGGADEIQLEILSRELRP
ncbi:MAG: acyl-CoA dehydrogenase family protein [Actinomycetota bacterium]|nr:acyl-CoA dehydrogenase family protein [Actinomycetota bacterium]